MKKRKEKIVCRIIINYSINYYLSSFKNNIFFFCRIGYELDEGNFFQDYENIGYDNLSIVLHHCTIVYYMKLCEQITSISLLILTFLSEMFNIYNYLSHKMHIYALRCF